MRQCLKLRCNFFFLQNDAAAQSHSPQLQRIRPASLISRAATSQPQREHKTHKVHLLAKSEQLGISLRKS